MSERQRCLADSPFLTASTNSFMRVYLGLISLKNQVKTLVALRIGQSIRVLRSANIDYFMQDQMIFVVPDNYLSW